MTWANVDDLFPEHPKVIEAGGDAAWLYICGLCFTNRNLTEGRIPKAVVPRLSDRKAPMRLAKRLVDVGLWHDKGDAYVIHDWDQYNEGAEKVKARKEQARNAARAKWAKHAGSNAQSSAVSSAQAHAPPPDAQCDEHVTSMPSAHAGAMPSHSSPSKHRSSSSNTVIGHGSEEEELRVADACRILAERLHEFRSEPIPIGLRRERWLDTTAADLRRKHAERLAELVAEGAAVEAMVDAIDPPPTQPEQPPSPYPSFDSNAGPVWDEVEDEQGHLVVVPRTVSA